MPDEQIVNAWGEPIDPDTPSSVHLVSPDERLDIDEGEGSDALEGGNDMDGWKPGDPV